MAVSLSLYYIPVHKTGSEGRGAMIGRDIRIFDTRDCPHGHLLLHALTKKHEKLYDAISIGGTDQSEIANTSP